MIYCSFENPALKIKSEPISYAVSETKVMG